MSYLSLTDYETFWTFSTTRALNKNDLSHYPCCDVWTTRNSKRARTSHTKETKWKTLLASLDPAVPDKKTALRAMMLEKGWREQVLLNRPCHARSPRHQDSRLPFKPHIPQQRHPVTVFSEEDQVPPSAVDNISTLYSPSPLPTINTSLSPGLRNH